MGGHSLTPPLQIGSISTVVRGQKANGSSSLLQPETDFEPLETGRLVNDHGAAGTQGSAGKQAHICLPDTERHSESTL